MNDTYAECLVKRKTPVSAHLVNIMMILLTLISLFLAFTFNAFAIILFCAVSFCTWLIIRNSRVEFEYLYIDGQLTVDQILGQAKRKTICTIAMADIMILAPSDSDELNSYRGGGKVSVVDFSSHTPHACVYTAIVQKGAVRREVLIEPDEKLLTCMYQSAPRKVKKQGSGAIQNRI